MEILELKQGYLDLIKAELSLFGVDTSQVSLNESYGLIIEDHLVDMAIFAEKASWKYSIPIRAYSLEDYKTIIFMPTREHYDEYCSNDEMELIIESMRKEINEKVSDLSKLFFEQVAEITFELTLEQRISESIKDNLKISSSLSDIENWKAKIILGNSIGGAKEDRLDVGDFDSIGYTWIGITSGTIVPVARGDEHHRGGDLMYYLKSKKMIPQDTYYPIFYHHDYVDANDSIALQAFKVWRKLGGPNIILNRESSQGGEPFHITMDDYIQAQGNIEITKGKLLPIGQKLIDMLTVVSKLCIESRNDERKQKRLYVECLKTYNFYLNKVKIFSTDAEKQVVQDIMKAEAIGGDEGIKQIEQLFFGFNSFKNNLHNQIRKAQTAKYDFERRDMAGVFGDLDLANHLLGSL
jgi:hypothetical protein